MATKLTEGKAISREIATALSDDSYKEGFTAKVTPDGVFLKAPNRRWTNARFASWDAVLGAAGAVSKELAAKADAASE